MWGWGVISCGGSFDSHIFFACRSSFLARVYIVALDQILSFYSYNTVHHQLLYIYLYICICLFMYTISIFFVHTICSWVDSGKADLHPWWNTALGHMPYRHLESFFDDVMSTCFRELKMHYSYSPYKKTSRGWWWKSYRPQLGQLCSTTFQEMRSTTRNIFSEMTKSKCWVGILKFSGSGDPSRLLTFGWRLSELILSLVRGYFFFRVISQPKSPGNITLATVLGAIHDAAGSHGSIPQITERVSPPKKVFVRFCKRVR